MKLFFIPYAGGSASFFNSLIVELKDTFDCILLEYAGHATRRNESFSSSFVEMVEDIAANIKKNIQENEPFSIFGYSMGSLIAYEALIGPLKHFKCSHLFVAAHYPPDASKLRKKYSEMTDSALCSEMQQFGGLDARIIENKRFLDIYLSIIRKDYQILEEYKYDGKKEKVSCGITVFYSEEDTAYAIMRGWENYTSQKIIYKKYNGNHFFLKKQEKLIANDMKKTKESWTK